MPPKKTASAATATKKAAVNPAHAPFKGKFLFQILWRTRWGARTMSRSNADCFVLDMIKDAIINVSQRALRLSTSSSPDDFCFPSPFFSHT